MSTPRSRRLGLLAIAGSAVLLLSGCILPLIPLPGPPPAPERPAGPNVDDFAFESFDARYVLGRDADGVATLETTETLVALFPESDQNRGIVRELVDRPNRQQTELEVVSVTDGEGEPLPYELVDDGGVTIDVLIGDDEFVHGRQEYVIGYTQRNVVSELDGVEHLYWNVNGRWLQAFGRVSVRVELAAEVAAGLDPASTCYFDRHYAERPCELVRDGDVLTASIDEVHPSQSLVLELIFERGLFEIR